MKILSSSQVRKADKFTIENEPILSVDLMERAAEAFVKKFVTLVSRKRHVDIVCGTGNNGGDGLAIGRILEHEGWDVTLYVVGRIDAGSEDFKINLDLANDYKHIRNKGDFPEIHSDSVVLDGLFGSGLSRPLEGLFASFVEYLNQIDCQKLSIDIASGLYADKPIVTNSIVFKPHHTISFQSPKLAFFQPSLFEFVGEWHVVDIGLIKTFIDKLDSSYYFTQEKDVSTLVPTRSKFDHKGNAGRLQLVSGSQGKMGASVLCSRAAMKTGIGLLTVHAPACGTVVLQISVPEAMVSQDQSEVAISSIPSIERVLGIGPGIGTSVETKNALKNFLKSAKYPIVLDADAINIIAEESLLELIPKESILTPHPGEFRRLIGDWSDDFEKLDSLRDLCSKHQLNVVLKGAYSAVCNSSGTVYFNPTGNAGMATGGSGDVLTGIISSLLAQGLAPFSSLKLGVYLHGLAGDLAAMEIGIQGLMASDIVSTIPLAMKNCMRLDKN